MRPPHRIVQALQHFAPTFAVMVAAAFLVGVCGWLLARWVRRVAEPQGGLEGCPPARSLHRFIVRLTRVGVLWVVAVLALRGSGIGVARWSWPEVENWLSTRGTKIVFLFAGAWVLMSIASFAINRFEEILKIPSAAPLEMAERAKRIETVGRLLRAVAATVIFGMAGLMALRQVDIDITPILTGAGVAGVALGFGAQYLVRDVIAGLFLILENQVRVGDIAEINGKGGLVESIRLRITVLRNQDGSVYIFPNGGITQIRNLTKDFSYAVLTIAVDWNQKIDHVTAVLADIGRELQADPVFAPSILAPMEVLGVDSFGNPAVNILLRMKTRPMEQWKIARELRRRIKMRFDREGILTPWSPAPAPAPPAPAGS